MNPPSISQKRTSRAPTVAATAAVTRVTNGQHGHHAEFAKSEKRDERKRIHSGQVGFAVRDVHRAPKTPAPSAAHTPLMRMRSGALRRGGDGQNGGANAHHQRSAKHASPTAPARLAQFVEKKKAPENPEQAVRIPQRKRDAQADIANGENGQGIGDRPQTSGEHAPK